MGLSPSKRVKNSLRNGSNDWLKIAKEVSRKEKIRREAKSRTNSAPFDSACNSAFAHCMSLTQYAFEGVFPYQLKTASDHIHATASPSLPLIRNWLHAPPDRSQVDAALRRVPPPDHDSALGLLLFKDWARELYTDAVVSAAGKALLVRIPGGVAGIVGIGAVTRPAPQLLGTCIGAFSLGVAVSVFLGLSAA